jgi:glycosyltransferase involved in cell wall biosynthesis
MEFEFDVKKSAGNKIKYDIDFHEVQMLWDDPDLILGNAQMTAMNSDVFKITAIIAIYNEEDIIAEVVDDLIGQGIHVHVLDDGSTDNSLEKLKRFCDSGLLTIEIFRPPVESSGTFFEWESILRRKEELARELDSDWFIHADADEFRESPFPGMSFAQGVRLVDRLGYNAIDFAVINFYPVEGEEIINEGIRQSFLHYEDGAEYDRLQIKCWKKQPDSVDLVAAGGHQAVFPERKVFPIRFILRHYPLRGREHARKKVFAERLPRFKNNDRIKGWHVQYDKYDEQSIFVRRAEELERYEPDKVRALLMTYNRELEALKANLEAVIRDKDAHIGNLETVIRDMNVQIGNLDTHTKNLEAKNAKLVIEKIRLDAEGAQYLRDMHEMKRVVQQKDNRILALENSLSWRITAPLRLLYSLIKNIMKHT